MEMSPRFSARISCSACQAIAYQFHMVRKEKINIFCVKNVRVNKEKNHYQAFINAHGKRKRINQKKPLTELQILEISGEFLVP